LDVGELKDLVSHSVFVVILYINGFRWSRKPLPGLAFKTFALIGCSAKVVVPRATGAKLEPLAGAVVRELSWEVVSFDPDSAGVQFGNGQLCPNGDPEASGGLEAMCAAVEAGWVHGSPLVSHPIR
jgi:hypothetical protein